MHKTLLYQICIDDSLQGYRKTHVCFCFVEKIFKSKNMDIHLPRMLLLLFHEEGILQVLKYMISLKKININAYKNTLGSSILKKNFNKTTST